MLVTVSGAPGWLTDIREEEEALFPECQLTDIREEEEALLPEWASQSGGRLLTLFF
jgi:hypothetical protein